MWNRRDWAILSSAAIGAFGLTLAIFWASPLQAGDANPLTQSIKIPTYTINSCQVTASLIENEQVTGAKDNVVLLQAGAIPKLQLVLVNTSADKDSDAPIHVEMRSASASDAKGRSMRIRPPVYSEDYNLSLKPGETRTIEIAFDKVTTTTGDTLTLFISKVTTAEQRQQQISAQRQRQVQQLVAEAAKLEKINNLQQAAELIRQAVIIDPQDDNARLALARIENLLLETAALKAAVAPQKATPPVATDGTTAAQTNFVSNFNGNTPNSFIISTMAPDAIQLLRMAVQPLPPTPAAQAPTAQNKMTP